MRVGGEVRYRRFCREDDANLMQVSLTKDIVISPQPKQTSRLSSELNLSEMG